MKDQLKLRVFTKNRSIQRREMAKWQVFKYHLKQRVCMDWVDKPQNYKDLYGILQFLRGSHLNNFSLKTLKLGWVAFNCWFSHDVTKFQSLNHEQKFLEKENGKIVALQISPKIESLYGSRGRQATQLWFVWNFATFARLPFAQFSAENS